MNNSEGFRVIIHLQLPQDRKKYFYYVDTSTHRTIYDVMVGIKSRFCIKKDVELQINDCWLHEHENVRVLHDGDVISVVEASNSRQEKKETDDNFAVSNELLDTTKCSKERENNETCATFDKKRKCRKKKLKHENIMPKLEETTDIYEGKDVNYSATDSIDENIPQSTNSSDLKRRKLSKTHVAFVSCTIDSNIEHLPTSSLTTEPCTSNAAPEIESEAQFTSAPIKEVNASKLNAESENSSLVKKKRRRRHKKRNTNLSGLSSNDSFTTEIPVVENKMSNKSPKHIKFVDDKYEECMVQNVEKEVNAVNARHENQIVLDEIPFTKVDISKTSRSTEKETNSSLQSISTPESSISKYGTHITTVEALRNKNSSLLIFECKRPKQSPDGNSKIYPDNEIDYLKYPLLKHPPKVNDFIAFKRWKMDDNYCPSISNYISAKVLQAPEGDGLISLKILNGQSELKEPLGKFSLTPESEEQEVENMEAIEIANLNFGDLLETRLMYP